MFLDPLEVLKHLPVGGGDRVGDFGAGPGTYAYALAERLPGGSVYAFEALPGHIEAMAKRKLPNLYPIGADLNLHVPLKDGMLSAAVVANLLHALSARERFAEELGRVLKPGARALVVDWMASFNNMGPHHEVVVTPAEATRLMGDAGFAVGPMLPAGSHHYAFIATKR